MVGPVEVKPFASKVRAEADQKGGAGWRLYDSADQQVAVILGDADRVEEIVRLINASVEASTPDAQTDHAFPQAVSYRDRSITQGGLTKREWFAGQAVVWLYPFISEINSGNDLDQVALARITAEVAFQIADAMEAARSKKEPG